MLFLIGDTGREMAGNGIAKSRAGRFTGERDGEDGGPGSLMEEVDEGDAEARVRVNADILGTESSGISARGICGTWPSA